MTDIKMEGSLSDGDEKIGRNLHPDTLRLDIQPSGDPGSHMVTEFEGPQKENAQNASNKLHTHLSILLDIENQSEIPQPALKSPKLQGNTGPALKINQNEPIDRKETRNDRKKSVSEGGQSPSRANIRMMSLRLTKKDAEKLKSELDRLENLCTENKTKESALESIEIKKQMEKIKNLKQALNRLWEEQKESRGNALKALSFKDSGLSTEDEKELQGHHDVITLEKFQKINEANEKHKQELLKIKNEKEPTSTKETLHPKIDQEVQSKEMKVFFLKALRKNLEDIRSTFNNYLVDKKKCEDIQEDGYNEEAKKYYNLSLLNLIKKFKDSLIQVSPGAEFSQSGTDALNFISAYFHEDSLMSLEKAKLKIREIFNNLVDKDKENPEIQIFFDNYANSEGQTDITDEQYEKFIQYLVKNVDFLATPDSCSTTLAVFNFFIQAQTIKLKRKQLLFEQQCFKLTKKANAPETQEDLNHIPPNKGNELNRKSTRVNQKPENDAAQSSRHQIDTAKVRIQKLEELYSYFEKLRKDLQDKKDSSLVSNLTKEITLIDKRIQIIEKEIDLIDTQVKILGKKSEIYTHLKKIKEIDEVNNNKKGSSISIPSTPELKSETKTDGFHTRKEEIHEVELLLKSRDEFEQVLESKQTDIDDLEHEIKEALEKDRSLINERIHESNQSMKDLATKLRSVIKDKWNLKDADKEIEREKIREKPRLSIMTKNDVDREIETLKDLTQEAKESAKKHVTKYEIFKINDKIDKLTEQGILATDRNKFKKQIQSYEHKLHSEKVIEKLLNKCFQKKYHYRQTHLFPGSELFSYLGENANKLPNKSKEESRKEKHADIEPRTTLRELLFYYEDEPRDAAQKAKFADALLHLRLWKIYFRVTQEDLQSFNMASWQYDITEFCQNKASGKLQIAEQSSIENITNVPSEVVKNWAENREKLTGENQINGGIQFALARLIDQVQKLEQEEKLEQQDQNQPGASASKAPKGKKGSVEAYERLLFCMRRFDAEVFKIEFYFKLKESIMAIRKLEAISEAHIHLQYKHENYNDDRKERRLEAICTLRAIHSHVKPYAKSGWFWWWNTPQTSDGMKSVNLETGYLQKDVQRRIRTLQRDIDAIKRADLIKEEIDKIKDAEEDKKQQATEDSQDLLAQVSKRIIASRSAYIELKNLLAKEKGFTDQEELDEIEEEMNAKEDKTEIWETVWVGIKYSIIFAPTRIGRALKKQIMLNYRQFKVFLRLSTSDKFRKLVQPIAEYFFIVRFLMPIMIPQSDNTKSNSNTGQSIQMEVVQFFVFTLGRIIISIIWGIVSSTLEATGTDLVKINETLVRYAEYYPSARLVLGLLFLRPPGTTTYLVVWFPAWLIAWVVYSALFFAYVFKPKLPEDTMPWEATFLLFAFLIFLFLLRVFIITVSYVADTLEDRIVNREQELEAESVAKKVLAVEGKINSPEEPLSRQGTLAKPGTISRGQTGAEEHEKKD